MLFQRVRRCKTVTFDNFCAISLATALEHHSANQFLKAATNLNVVQPKLFQATRQDDLRFSDCTVSVIQILDDADAAFRILGAGLRTVLSVTTMFADKPHRLNGRMRAAILCFDDLATGYRTRGWATRAAGYRAAISCFGTFETCRLRRAMSEFEVQSGKHMLVLSSSQFDPTETSRLRLVGAICSSLASRKVLGFGYCTRQASMEDSMKRREFIT